MHLTVAFSFVRSVWASVILAMEGGGFLSVDTIIFCFGSSWNISQLLFGGLKEIGIRFMILGLKIAN